MIFHRLALILSLLSAAHLAFATAAPSEMNPKAVEAAKRLFAQVDKPEPRTYRQMLQMIKPFGLEDFNQRLEERLKPWLDQRFPMTALEDRGDVLELTVGTKNHKEHLTIKKNDPKIYAIYRGVEITWTDMTDPWVALDKMSKVADKAEAARGKSAWSRVFIPQARADWSLFGGLALIGVAIGVGAYFISRAHTTHTVNVNVPTNYTVQGTVNGQVAVPITAPQLNPYLPSGQR